MDQNAENAATELLQAAGAAAAVARLIYFNLSPRFPALLGYLIFLAVIDLVFGLQKQTSGPYFWSYLILEPLKCVFSVLAVREILSLAFDDYPGIRTVGRWVMYAGVALALGISLLLTGFFWASAAVGRAHSRLFYFEVSQRSIVFSLAVVIVVILFFLSKYPLHLNKNTLVSSAFFSAVLLSESARLPVDSLAPRLNIRYVDWVENLFVAVCLVGWVLMLQVEPRKSPAQIRFSGPHEDHLLHQLNSLNQLMTRSARR